MPVKKIFDFKVRGKHAFPLDMLRYDACWPVDERAIDAISISRHDKEDYEFARTANMRSHHEPSVNRWRSFGWEVTEV